MHIVCLCRWIKRSTGWEYKMQLLFTLPLKLVVCWKAISLVQLSSCDKLMTSIWLVPIDLFTFTNFRYHPFIDFINIYIKLYCGILCAPDYQCEYISIRIFTHIWLSCLTIEHEITNFVNCLSFPCEFMHFRLTNQNIYDSMHNPKIFINSVPNVKHKYWHTYIEFPECCHRYTFINSIDREYLLFCSIARLLREQIKLNGCRAPMAIWTTTAHRICVRPIVCVSYSGRKSQRFRNFSSIFVLFSK